MVAGQSYIANNSGSSTQFNLPTIAAIGTTIDIIGGSSTSWTIAQNGGQQINLGDVATTPGAGGSISSTKLHDSISLVCITANTEWAAYGSIGNLTYI